MPIEKSATTPIALMENKGSRAPADRMDQGDVRLLNLVVQRDPDAFTALYRSYFPRLTRFLDRMTRNGALIEEIINDTLYVVWDKAATFDHTCKVSTWIFAIAYRQACKAIQRSDVPMPTDSELFNEDKMLEPEGYLSQRQLAQKVAAALDAMPVEQRTVVSLTYYHGMGYQEIAETMDCPVNTVKTRMFHARRRLKDLLSTCMGPIR